MTRYLSLGSVSGAVLYPFACFIVLHPEWPVLAAAVGAAALILWRHRANIARIREGTENILSFGRRA
jgi:glycerol-3-phosphate acyltransferase PlsY